MAGFYAHNIPTPHSTPVSAFLHQGPLSTTAHTLLGKLISVDQFSGSVSFDHLLFPYYATLYHMYVYLYLSSFHFKIESIFFETRAWFQRDSSGTAAFALHMVLS